VLKACGLYSFDFEPLQQRVALAPSGGRTPVRPAPVTIVAGVGGQLRYQVDSPSEALAGDLDLLIRGRRQWLSVPGTAETVRARCRDALFQLGLKEDDIRTLAQAATLQITLREDAPSTAARFPWEFVLAKATRQYRPQSLAGAGGAGFLVFRYLDSGKKPAAAAAHAPKTLLVVESAPGALSDTYDFESERRLVSSSLGIEVEDMPRNPDRATLEAHIKKGKPDVIHLAGIDSMQGSALLQSTAPPQPGMYFSAGRSEVVIEFDELAAILTALKRPPQLVSFNIYNSSSGAAAVVRAGAGAAIGFYDEIDDAVAELFYATFYAEWKRSGWDLLRSFHTAWLKLAAYASKVRGTGMVLWTRRPLMEERSTPIWRGTSATARAAVSPAAEAIQRPEAIDDWSSYLAVEYLPPERLNYSLLHNNTNVLRKLTIKRQKEGIYKGVGIDVRVSAGAQEAVFRTTVDLDDMTPKVDLEGSVRVPLTSDLTRTLDESMFSTVYTSVRWGRHVLLEDTRRVSFTPVDEWKYDDTNGRWLPSFVFSRDPVVREIVDKAQRYLIALRDDAGAGFDGYQSYEPAATSIDDRAAAIDAQVQAIWWALVHDYGLGYINPPPSFADEAQRLRTPSEVIQGKRGTCIDLMLLIAACLEYVEIYPVLFLLNDHAFPGYWRSDDSYVRLGKILTEGAPADDDTYVAPWMLGRSRFSDVTELVRQGHIVPLESVSLTSRSGFWPAVDEGLKNLRSKRQFHSMFDLRTARSDKNRVTPIPIWSKRT
jgi:hypothetical protein